MKRWPSFIFLLCTHTYLSLSRSVLHCVTSSRASKGPLRRRRWTFESSPITSHHVGHAEFSLASVLFSSIHRFGCSPCQHALASDPLVHVDKKTAQLHCTLCVLEPSSLPKLAFVPYPCASSFGSFKLLELPFISVN